jgi:hypothetical protein
MSTDTPVRSVTAPDAGYSIVFPGTWSVIPLETDEIMKTVIGRIVKKQVGVADRLARTRRMMIEELLTTAQRSRDAGAHSMHLSLEILPGVPFPAALIASDFALAQRIDSCSARRLRRIAGRDLSRRFDCRAQIRADVPHGRGRARSVR